MKALMGAWVRGRRCSPWTLTEESESRPGRPPKVASPAVQHKPTSLSSSAPAGEEAVHIVICMCTANMQQNISQRSRLSTAPDLRVDKLFCCRQLTRSLGFELCYSVFTYFFIALVHHLITGHIMSVAMQTYGVLESTCHELSKKYRVCRLKNIM